MNNSTALGAETKKKEKLFNQYAMHYRIPNHEKLKEVRYQDVYHKALCYCLGISDDTRRNVYRIYDFKTGCVITECLHEGWQTSEWRKGWEWHSFRLAMDTPAFSIMKMQRNRWTSAGSTRWRKYSAVPMHRISGRQFRFGIRNMPHTTISCMPYWDELSMLVSIDVGSKE